MTPSNLRRRCVCIPKSAPQRPRDCREPGQRKKRRRHADEPALAAARLGAQHALHEALAMKDSERNRRAASLAQAAAALPPAQWFADQLAALDQQADEPMDVPRGG